jgi:transposase
MDRPVEIISTVARKRRWGLEEKARLLDEAFRPGGSVSAVCGRYDVSRSLLYVWRRRAREGRIPGLRLTAAPPPIFVPIQIGAGEGGAGTETERQAPSTHVEIVLLNGRVLRVEDSIAPRRLARVVAVLDAVRLP